MPGSKKEVVNAREEGVAFQFNVQPQYILRNRKGQVSAVGMIRTEMGEPGPDGRRARGQLPVQNSNSRPMCWCWRLVSRLTTCRGCGGMASNLTAGGRL